MKILIQNQTNYQAFLNFKMSISRSQNINSLLRQLISLHVHEEDQQNKVSRICARILGTQSSSILSGIEFIDLFLDNVDRISKYIIMRLQSPELNCDGREINHFLELVNKLKMLNNVKNKESILKLLYLLSGTAKSSNNYSIPVIIESPNPLPQSSSSFSV